jgi:hypothetical protein
MLIFARRLQAACKMHVLSFVIETAAAIDGNTRPQRKSASVRAERQG